MNETEKRMIGYRCKRCGRIYYPKHAVCMNCDSREFEKVELGDKCKLITYTKLYATPKGVEEKPLILGIVEFENGVRATGQLTSENVEIGMKMKPVWGFLRKIDSKEVYGFKFKPAT